MWYKPAALPRGKSEDVDYIREEHFLLPVSKVTFLFDLSVYYRHMQDEHNKKSWNDTQEAQAVSSHLHYAPTITSLEVCLFEQTIRSFNQFLIF